MPQPPLSVKLDPVIAPGVGLRRATDRVVAGKAKATSSSLWILQHK